MSEPLPYGATCPACFVTVFSDEDRALHGAHALVGAPAPEPVVSVPVITSPEPVVTEPEQDPNTGVAAE